MQRSSGLVAMARVAGYASTIIAAAIMASTGGALAQSTQQLPLPEVTVTAPPVNSPAPKLTPYFGNPRVEEDKWPDIPCDASRVGVAAAGSCKSGSPQESGPGLIPNGPNSNCRIAHDLVMTNLGPLTIEADVMVFDPYYVSAIGHQHGYCAVESGHSDLHNDFPDMNQVTRKGGSWRNFSRGW